MTTATPTTPKRVLDIRSAPGRHWVGDGLPVHNLFGYNGPGVAEFYPEFKGWKPLSQQPVETTTKD